MDNLQARLSSAEKRTVLMEQRLLHALDERLQEKSTPAQPSGCSWSLFALMLCVFLSILLFKTRGAAGTHVVGAPAFPVMVPNSLPPSPLMLPMGGGAVPGTFMRGM